MKTGKMYKTVRHGENSLQYKILAQQEEGITNVKCRKSTRGKTAGIITILLLLVCGVIATAVLVPLVLTNDFITLTGTFQKFSVSTLRRSHSGNHVVVIAKKPHGWNSSRQSVLPPPPVKSTNSTASHVVSKAKETVVAMELPPVNDTLNTYTTTPRTTISQKKISEVAATKKDAVPEVETITKSTAHLSSSEYRENDRSALNEIKLPQTTTTTQKEDNNAANLIKKVQGTSTTIKTPSWYEGRNWGFNSPSINSWANNRITNNPVSTAVGGICAVSVIIIMIIVLMKSLPDRKKTVKKESPESKEDKKRLLKPSSRTSDEE